MDEWMDRNSPCVLQDFVPFGPAALLPFDFNKHQLKQGKGTDDHTFTHSWDCVCQRTNESRVSQTDLANENASILDRFEPTSLSLIRFECLKTDSADENASSDRFEPTSISLVRFEPMKMRHLTDSNHSALYYHSHHSSRWDRSV